MLEVGWGKESFEKLLKIGECVKTKVVSRRGGGTEGVTTPAPPPPPKILIVHLVSHCQYR